VRTSHNCPSGSSGVVPVCLGGSETGQWEHQTWTAMFAPIVEWSRAANIDCILFRSEWTANRRTTKKDNGRMHDHLQALGHLKCGNVDRLWPQRLQRCLDWLYLHEIGKRVSLTNQGIATQLQKRASHGGSKLRQNVCQRWAAMTSTGHIWPVRIRGAQRRHPCGHREASLPELLTNIR
jgi:hypothetical protein